MSVGEFSWCIALLLYCYYCWHASLHDKGDCNMVKSAVILYAREMLADCLRWVQHDHSVSGCPDISSVRAVEWWLNTEQPCCI